MDNRYIGVFDSGVGGLSAVKELIKKLPGENIVYFGDTGRVPYGTRSNETIIKYAVGDMNFLKTHDIKLVVIACGTVSSVATETLKSMFNIPIIGVVEPTARAAAMATKNKKIGIIGTSSTVASGKYEQAIGEIDKDIFVHSIACPMFVPLAENNMAESEAAYLIAKEYLSGFDGMGIDTLILGCTHYPLLKNTVRRVMGDNIALIDAGKSTADFAAQKLHSENKLAEKKADKQYKFFVSDSVDGFLNVANIFLDKDISEMIEKIDIERY